MLPKNAQLNYPVIVQWLDLLQIITGRLLVAVSNHNPNSSDLEKIGQIGRFFLFTL